MKKLVSLLFALFILFEFYNPSTRIFALTIDEVPEEDIEELPTDPGIQMTEFARDIERAPATGDANILSIIFQNFLSNARFFASIGSCEAVGNQCVKVDNLSIMAQQYDYLYGNDEDAKGSPLLPQFAIDKLVWPETEDDELRYQYPGCYKSSGYTSEVLKPVIERVVNSFLAITTNNQPHVVTALVGGRLNAALFSSYDPVTNLAFRSPREHSDFYEDEGGIPRLKAAYAKLFEDCEPEGTSKTVPSREEPITGEISGGPSIDISSTTGETIDFASALRGAAWCISSIPNAIQCLSKRWGYKFGGGIWTVAPGHPAYAAWGGGPVSESELPDSVREETKTMISKVREGGSWGANIPFKFWENKPSYDDSHGNVASRIGVTMEASPGEIIAETADLVYDRQYESNKLWQLSDVCGPLSLTHQEELQKNPNINLQCTPFPKEPTSNWELGDPLWQPGATYCGNTVSLGSYRDGMIPQGPLIPDAELNNDYMLQIIDEAAAEINIPTCVLEAVAMIEGGMHWTQEDTERFKQPGQCIPNMSSAAGPFQITTTKDTCGGNCPRLSRGCPNTWGNTQGSPCDAPVAAVRAAEILRDKAKHAYSAACPNGLSTFRDGLSTRDWKAQRDRVEKSACHYYGDDTKHVRLKGLSYRQFVVAHCQAVDP